MFENKKFPNNYAPKFKLTHLMKQTSNFE